MINKSMLSKPFEIGAGDVERLHSGGSFFISESIPAASDLVYEINLPRDDYSFGNILLVSSDKINSFLSFTTSLNDGKAMSTDRRNFTISLCVYQEWWTKGFVYSDDLKLSNKYFGSFNYLYIFIKSCQIVGNKIELTLTNSHPLSPMVVSIKGNYRVYA